MEASELCDKLKNKINDLEKELVVTRAHRDTIEGALGDCKTVLNQIAAHLGVEACTVSETKHRVWIEVNNLRRELKAASSDKDDLDRMRSEAKERTKQLRELSDELESTQRRARDAASELKKYNKKYKELEQAAKEALSHVGLGVQPEEYTVQAYVLATLSRLAEAAHNDTVDTRMNPHEAAVEQACYSAESHTGIMCREANPWSRVEYVLKNMSAEISRLRNHAKPVSETVKQRIWQIQRNLNAEAGRTAIPHQTDVEEVLAVLDLIEKKAMEAQNVRAACLKLKDLL